MTPDQWFSCEKKIRYGRMSTALKAVDRLAKKGKTHLEAYPCLYCEGFHIGRKRTGGLKQYRLEF